jgi:glycosyltransferase involved in cell wall biosynthesis
VSIGKNRVLLISQVFYPDEVAVANLFTNLCSVLVKSDTDINVWCAQPSYTCKTRQHRLKTYNGIKIHYLRSTNFHKDKFYGRILNYFSFSVSAVLKLLLFNNRSLVITHTSPPFLAIIISFICRLKKIKILYILLDVFPDGLVRLNKISPKNIFIRLWRRLHFSAIRKCNKIVVIGRDMKDWLLNNYPEGSDKVIYIPLWQDEELIKPLDFIQNPFVTRHNLQNSFVVQYSGNMGLWNEMKTFGKVVNLKPENVIFVFVGGGMRLNELIDSFDTPVPENVLLFPFIPNKEYAYSVSACHVALVSFCKEVAGMAVPSKIIGIMAAGIPVIALVPAESEIAYIVKEENCGIVVKPGDSAGLLNAINVLKSNEELRVLLGSNGRKAFENKYTSTIIAGKYLALIEEIGIP